MAMVFLVGGFYLRVLHQRHTDDLNRQIAAAAASGAGVQVCQLAAQRACVNNRSGVNGTTPLQQAAAHGHVAVVSVLLAKGARVNDRSQRHGTALTSAALYGQTACALVLVQHGADVNVRDDDGMTPLLIAARQGYPAFVRFLLQHGADATTKDGEGHSFEQESLIGLQFPSRRDERRKTLEILKKAGGRLTSAAPDSSAAGELGVRAQLAL